MKAILIFLLMASTFFSCMTTSFGQTPYAIPDGAQIVNDYNIGKHSGTQGGYYKGEVQIGIVGGKYLIYVRSIADTLIFAFQTTDPTDAGKAQYLNNAEVLYLHNTLVVNSLTTNKRVIFKIREANLPANVPNPTDVLAGYGIAQMKGAESAYLDGASANFPVTFNNDPINVVVCQCLSLESVQVTSCSSGGEGATSCQVSQTGQSSGAISSCSVTCGQGYHACCTPN